MSTPEDDVTNGEGDENHSTKSHSSSSETETANPDEADKSRKPVTIGGNSYTKREYAFVISTGLFLTFNSGYVNGSCLSGMLVPVADGDDEVKASVAGFTGYYTNSALSLADGNFKDFRFQLTLVASFIFGSFVSGMMTPRTKPYRIEPTYGPTFLIGGIFLLIASILAAVHEHSVGEKSSHQFFHFAAAANGIQNGISSLYSANLIRSTHFTGCSTDIGLILGQLIRGNRENLWKLYVLCSLAMSFWTGGLLSFFATRRFESYSLLFNASLFLAIGVSLVIFLMNELGVTIQQAMLGTWKWKKALDLLNLTTADGEPIDEQFLMDVFDKIDSDGSGTIEEDELYHSLKEAGLKGVTRKGIRAMINTADDDGDGAISKEEWRELVTGAA